jgi:excisionase family DNA binding protein
MEAFGKVRREPGELLTGREVATRLGVSIEAVRSWTRSGRLRCVKLGKAARFDPRDIERIIERGSLDASPHHRESGSSGARR